MKKFESMGQPDCSYCGGLHYGTPAGKCPFRCGRCHLDTRDDAEGFGHKKCACAPLPVAQNPVIPCPHNALRKCKAEGYTFAAYICGNCSQIFKVEEYEEPKISEEPMFDGRPPWGLRNRQA